MPSQPRQSGFSLVELVIVLAIFLVVSAAIFGMLDVAQARYRSEQQFLDAFQNARAGLELLTRDVHAAGFPALNSYSENATISFGGSTGAYPTDPRVAVPILGVVGTSVDETCFVNSTCTIPNDFELILETDLQADEQVEWIYYRLDTPGNTIQHPPAGGGTLRTLYRAVITKTTTGTPWTDPGAPFVENVTQDPGVAVDLSTNPPVFIYICPGGTIVAPGDCRPDQVQEIYVVLRVRSTSPDLQTGEQRMITLQSAARLLNPPL